MWCHLCTKDYPDFEDFRIHIMQMHRNSSGFCEESSESEESDHEPENAEASEIDNDGENKSDDSTDDLSTFPKCDFNKIESDNTSILNTSSKKQNFDEKEIDDNSRKQKYNEKILDTSKSVSNTSTRKQPFKKNKSSVKSSALSSSLRERHVNENKSEANKNVLNKSLKKRKASSISKKRVLKRKKKVVFGKKVLSKHKNTVAVIKEESSEHSENEIDHSESLVNGGVEQDSFNSQPMLNNNFVNSQSLPANNYVISQPISNNNPVFLVNPCASQGANNYVIGNQAVQPPFYVVNPVVANPTTLNNETVFDFSSKNILKWLTKHKELCKNMQYPLPSSLFNQVKAVHKGIFDHYCTSSVREETSAVLKVYEELDCMIHKHINSINNALNVL